MNNAVDPLVLSARDRYMAAVDTQFAYDIAAVLAEDGRFHNSEWGDRTAGSEAEHRAADWLAQKMQEIGLQDVRKVPVKCDLWQFGGARLQIMGDEKVISPHSYAAPGTDAQGITAEVIYVGRGAAADYEGVDVRGKIVLVDINQRADWWIAYPMLEARHRGAAAIMSSEAGGFSEISDGALNAQDLCGPARLTCVSLSRSDAAYLKEKLARGPVTATLTVDNAVKPGEGTSYNIVGRIAGRASDYQIVVGAHYDAHFQGFQDDGCGVGLALAMAKAMIDSGYRPENDIVFCLHGAEEWGASGSMYDWAVGSWEMIHTLHPEWQKRTLAFINFELPAYEFDNYTTTCSAPELYTMLRAFAKGPLAPEPEGCFPEGVLTDGYMTTTFSDDFAYYASGVPSTVNGFMFQKDMETVFPFYMERYHSNFDTKATYNERVMAFNAKYYGALAMYIDSLPALPLDFTKQCARLSKAIDERIMAEAHVDVSAYRAALGRMEEAAGKLWRKVLDVNRAEGRALTDMNLALFKLIQDAFLGLMYDAPVVPHEAPQRNIALLEQIIAALQSGDGKRAADEYAWRINNGFEWYAMHFSPEVIAVQDGMLWGEKAGGRLYWGENRLFEKARVEAATRSLRAKCADPCADYSREIEIYALAVEAQRGTLRALAAREVRAMDDFVEMCDRHPLFPLS